MECPICNAELETDYGETIGGHLGEEINVCPNGCYSYEYHYGATTYQIGDKLVGYSYNDEKEFRQKQLKKVKNLIKKYKGDDK